MSYKRSRVAESLTVATVALASILLTHVAVAGQCPAGPPGGNDYRYVRGHLLDMVESRHFQPQVESLSKGVTGSAGGDINYVLKLYPNHPRALLAMVRWSEKYKADKPPDADYSIECFFERALRLSPDYHIVRMLFAQYLAKKGRLDAAIGQVDYVVASSDDNPMTYYNAGLVYLELSAFGKALAQAHKVRAMGLERPELAQRLKDLGKWVEPAPKLDVASPAGAPSAPQRP